MRVWGVNSVETRGVLFGRHGNSEGGAQMEAASKYLDDVKELIEVNRICLGQFCNLYHDHYLNYSVYYLVEV